jgi:hypothetical protein
LVRLSSSDDGDAERVWIASFASDVQKRYHCGVALPRKLYVVMSAGASGRHRFNHENSFSFRGILHMYDVSAGTETSGCLIVKRSKQSSRQLNPYPDYLSTSRKKIATLIGSHSRLQCYLVVAATSARHLGTRRSFPAPAFW